MEVGKIVISAVTVIFLLLSFSPCFVECLKNNLGQKKKDGE